MQYLFLVIALLFSWNSLACSLERTPKYSMLFLSLDELSIAQFELERSEILTEVSKLEDQLKVMPITIDFNEQVQHETSAGAVFSKDYSESSSVSLGYDLNFKKISLQKRIIDEKQKLLYSNLQVTDNKHSKSVFFAAFDILESLELEKLFQSKKKAFLEQSQYYETLNKSGILKISEVSELRSKIRSLDDKIHANTVKKNEKLFFLGLESSDFKSYPPITSQIFKNIELDCEFSPETIKKQITELKILEYQQELTALSARFNFSLDLEVSQTKTATAYSDEGSLAFSLKIPLYDGGSNSSQKRDLNRIQKYKQKNLIRSRIELRELFERRKKTEGVFILSINSLEKQLNELKTRIEELDLRSSMGQSVFLDYSNKKIEYLELKEGLLRLKTDFLTGWIDFLEQVNGYKSS